MRERWTTRREDARARHSSNLVFVHTAKRQIAALKFAGKNRPPNTKPIALFLLRLSTRRGIANTTRERRSEACERCASAHPRHG